MPADEKTIYLTFDDGPISEVTEFVLDTLADYNASATFFCIGDNVRKHPTIFELIKTQGHSVGNHTFNHLNGWDTEDGTYLSNIQKCAEQLKIPTSLFRPPYGRIKKSQAKHLLPGKTIVMWDVLTGDFSQKISPEICLKKTIQYGRPGSIILFHDSLKARKNMEYALPRALKHFKNQGYSFRALPMSGL
ncbi:polysaccharide deacetylase family protein [Persicitalea sp.]|uniref:polysaccharide deacetylase family protein n=1 Tax=Persicitalea sp. TaxID=3100273 RepID=UPI003593D8F8